ncbi:hypothetical protein Tsubulata_015047 [Turnera subulata]|uniref:Uncharacterized protein n=1 Tax=Turnera subulata TaxID=218843 RepID=A0A9Q0G9Z4_9ROSI|nr:hypothetical protein Tsubulata_015047 [Turnera subulata]
MRASMDYMGIKIVGNYTMQLGTVKARKQENDEKSQSRKTVKKEKRSVWLALGERVKEGS